MLSTTFVDKRTFTDFEDIFFRAEIRTYYAYKLIVSKVTISTRSKNMHVFKKYSHKIITRCSKSSRTF